MKQTTINGHKVIDGVCQLCDAGDPTNVITLAEPCSAEAEKEGNQHAKSSSTGVPKLPPQTR